MTNSMTGFGRGEAESDNIKYTVEVKTVNHRFLDISVKLPQFAYSLEDKIESLLKEYISRGKVDILVTIKAKNISGKKYIYDKDALSYYINVSKEIENIYENVKSSSIYELLRLPGVIIEEDTNTSSEEMWKYLKKASKDAFSMLLASRKNEGERLKNDIEKKLVKLKELADILSKNEPIVVEKYKEKLKENLAKFIESSAIDENRIAAEVVFFSDKICIDEEIVRLNSHLSEIKECFSKDEPIGRKMDFIIQELNREANTILSKSTDIVSSNVGIEMKTLIEKVREQVQNLE